MTKLVCHISHLKVRPSVYILIIIAMLLLVTFNVAFAARTDNSWDTKGTYLETNVDGGYDILINGLNHYINFNALSGETGYG